MCGNGEPGSDSQGCCRSTRCEPAVGPASIIGIVRAPLNRGALKILMNLESWKAVILGSDGPDGKPPIPGGHERSAHVRGLCFLPRLHILAVGRDDAAVQRAVHDHCPAARAGARELALLCKSPS